jgi:peptidoglycan/LPS O-acetylase OafA/YrhL
MIDSIVPIENQHKTKAEASRFSPLDGMRGIAILLVIFVHTFKYEGNSLFGRILTTFADSGWIGVTLFFVLSGFLITGILLDTQHKQHYLRDFFARRSLRIFPLYFGFLVVYFFVLPHLPDTLVKLPQPQSGEHIYYWSYLTNMKEWLSGTANSIPPLDPLWSLAVEEQVYLFWPFLIRLVPPRWLPHVLVGMAVFSFGWRFLTRLTAQSIDLSYGWAPANLESFAAGGFVAWISRESGKLLKIWAPRLAIASSCFLMGMFIGQKHFHVAEAPVQILTVGISGLVIFFASLIGCSVIFSDRSLLNRVLSNSWLRALGKYSYAIYLFHSVVIELLVPIIFSPSTGIIRGRDVFGSLLLTGAVTVCSVILACLSWYGWESQFLRLKKYFPSSGRVVRL